jgi:hypothetical protein
MMRRYAAEQLSYGGAFDAICARPLRSLRMGQSWQLSVLYSHSVPSCDGRMVPNIAGCSVRLVRDLVSRDHLGSRALAIIGTVALTALWTAHLVVYVRKVTLAKRSEIVQSQAAVSRRAMITLFVRALGAGAVMSASPASAQACPGGTGACEQFYNDIERGQFPCEFSRPCYDSQGRCFCINPNQECS